MPIVETPDPDSPLSQGDILTGIRFFSTATCWDARGGESVKAPFTLCMVLSRPCVAAHKETFIVAAVEPFKNEIPKGLDTFEKYLSFMVGIRDGRTSPDVFYLGQLPGRKGRHAARFDSLHTIQTPQEGEDMKAFLRNCRIASLNIEFCRDLHVRVFNAFASLGFDDHRWFSTEDLRALVDSGTVELVGLEKGLAEKVAARSAAAAEGKGFPETEIETARTKADRLREKLAPYQAELERRNPPI